MTAAPVTSPRMLTTWLGSPSAARPIAFAAAGMAKVPAFPAGEGVFPEEPPLVASPDFGHWVLQGVLWGLLAITAGFVLTGCVHTIKVIIEYYR